MNKDKVEHGTCPVCDGELDVACDFERQPNGTMVVEYVCYGCGRTMVAIYELKCISQKR